jgi:hypothetical protein
VEEYSRSDCFDDYRLGQLQGPLITILGCIYGVTAERSPDADEMFLSMATRACGAIRDLFPGAAHLATSTIRFLRDQRFRRHEDRRGLGESDIRKRHEYDRPDVVRTHLAVAKSRFGVDGEE